MMSPSFADECFGVILSVHGAEVFRTSLRFLNLSRTTRGVLSSVLSTRNTVSA